MDMSSNIVQKFVNLGKKIVCVGRNYREHAAELGNAVPTEPVIFLKPTTSYLQEGGQIKIPKGTDEIHHEVELGVIISKTGKSIPESSVMNHIGGYCLALDMTNRTLQSKLKSKGLPWALAKGFDTSCPVSNYIPAVEVNDPHNIDLWLKVNGEMKQNGNTKDMIFTIPFLISWISEYYTLEPGDLILTGTPEGVGPVKSGDVLECGLGTLTKMTFPVE